MLDHHLIEGDVGPFTRLRLTAFGQAVIEIANDPAFDEWTFSRKIRHALDQETDAQSRRQMLKLLKESKTPNPAACVEDIHYLPDRSLNREGVARLPPPGGSSRPPTWSSSANPALVSRTSPRHWSTPPDGATTAHAISGWTT